jgi:Kinesin motor domain
MKGAEKLIRDIQSKRKTRKTNCNDVSSRGHVIYTIRILSARAGDENASPTGTETRFTIGDLAGNEDNRKTGNNTSDKMSESSKINLSVYCLGACIEAMRTGKRPSFRDCKLTRVLQQSLGGGLHPCVTSMICCINPMPGMGYETINALQYASKLKGIPVIACPSSIPSTPSATNKRFMEGTCSSVAKSTGKRLSCATGNGGLSSTLGALSPGGPVDGQGQKCEDHCSDVEDEDMNLEAVGSTEQSIKKRRMPDLNKSSIQCEASGIIDQAHEESSGLSDSCLIDPNQKVHHNWLCVTPHSKLKYLLIR